MKPLALFVLFSAIPVAGLTAEEAELAGSRNHPISLRGPEIELTRDLLRKFDMQDGTTRPESSDEMVLLFRRPGSEDWELLKATQDKGCLRWKPPSDGLYELGMARARVLIESPPERIRQVKTRFWIRVHTSAGFEAIRDEGLKALCSGDAQAASGLLEKAAALDPGDAETLATWGVALLELSNHESAALRLQESLRLDPVADTALNLAIARFRLKEWDKAWAACQLVLRWSESESRLKERAAEIGVAIAARLEERKRRLEVYGEIVKWAGETEGGKEAAKELK
ncbi:MAG: hypothetical protein FD180_217 [Planctomycetota bacterium]|nr:MAG: hypothetical protein FD180_217 [Planctomycetota bacterium]